MKALRKQIAELQKQLQEQQQQLQAAQARQESADAKAADVAAAQSQIATTSASLQTATASLLQALQEAGRQHLGFAGQHIGLITTAENAKKPHDSKIVRLLCVSRYQLSCLFFRTSPVAAFEVHVPFNAFGVAQFDFVLVTVEMVVQVGVGDRGTRVQLQSDLVQLFQRLDLAVLDQLRDLVDGNIAPGPSQRSGSRQQR